MGKALPGFDSDDGEQELKINKDYAQKYDKWRESEVLQKLKDKYGKKGPTLAEDGEESSSSESEPEWTATDERDFLKTLGALKGNNPRIYDKSQRFFKEKMEEESSTSSKKPSQKETGKIGMTLRDYEVALVTERDGKFDDEDMEEPKDEGYYKKAERLKKEFKAAAADLDSDEDDTGGFLKKRVKSAVEKQKEDDDYAEWLKGEGKNVNLHADEDLTQLKDQWTDPKLDENEAFLRDYLLNKKYEVDDEVNPEAPTYDDIAEVEEELEKTEDFEHKYNFRFEEPDQDFIKQYPRTIKDSVRKGNEKRKENRDERKKRKEEEKKQRIEDIRVMKSLKKREIEEKLKKLRDIAGDETLPLSIEDLEKDFDPKEYDERMQKLFANEYYDADDHEKPVFSDDSDAENSDYDNMEVGSSSKHRHFDDDDNDESVNEATSKDSKRPEKDSRRKKKRNSRFKEAVDRQKPLFDPKQKTFEDYFNEYYSLDYEDIIGDNLRTKFKYRNVPANKFGLTTEEILDADDKQLNTWVSVKKASQYRTEEEEEHDRKVFEHRAKTPKKQKVFAKKPEDDVEENPTKKKSGAKVSDNKTVKKATSAPTPKPAAMSSSSKKKNRRKKKAGGAEGGAKFKKPREVIAGVDANRLKAYSVSNKSIKRKIYGTQTAAKKPRVA